MEVYKIPIEFAFIVFPFIAFILTIPFLIYQYRKYGAIPMLKSAIFYSLILYLICAYFLVILPLPPIETVSKMTGDTTQLSLFRFVKDILVTVNFNIDSFSDILNIFKSSTVYTVLFNLVLTLPFGIYLRYFFKMKWYQSLIYSFLLSLFFELTQLSGLYGIYPRPYRLFDVDDLLINTLGGLIGHGITPLLTFFLPTIDELEEKSYKKGTRVTLLRRLLATLIDMLFIIIISVVCKILFYSTVFSKYYMVIALFIYYIPIPLLTSGQTLGKKFLRLKIVSMEPPTQVKWYQILFRNILLAYIFIYPISWINIIKTTVALDIMERLYLVLSIIQIINIVCYLISLVKKDHLFLYEIVSKTKNISIIDRNTNKNKQEKVINEKENLEFELIKEKS